MNAFRVTQLLLTYPILIPNCPNIILYFFCFIKCHIQLLEMLIKMFDVRNTYRVSAIFRRDTSLSLIPSVPPSVTFRSPTLQGANVTDKGTRGRTELQGFPKKTPAYLFFNINYYTQKCIFS